MGEVILSVKDLKKRFGENEVLKGISFDVHQGEKIAILGPSGSGKSTLLRCINRLETYDSGSVIFHGESIDSARKLHELRQNIGMVFQRFNLFSNLTVLGNIIEAPVHVKKVPKNEAVVRARELLDMVGLADKEDAMPRQLSGGQQQRVAIARAMAMDPQVMLFDEPTSALDPELVGEVLKVIRKVAQEGMTILIVTHEMDFARGVADRILFMDQGVISVDTTPEEFFEHPKTERIAQFIRKVKKVDETAGGSGE